MAAPGRRRVERARPHAPEVASRYDQPANAVLGAVDFGLAFLKALGLAGIARLDRQHGEALERRRVRRLELDQAAQLPSLGLTVAGTRGQPRAECSSLHGTDRLGRGPPCGLPESTNVFGGDRQIKVSQPDRQVVRPALQAPAQPGLGFVEPTGQECVPRPAQPDSIVVLIGSLEKHVPAVDGDGLGIVLPEILEHFAGFGSMRPGRGKNLADVNESALQPE